MMRQHPRGRVAAAKIQSADTRRCEEALLLVCGGLVLALIALAGRIVAAL